MLSAHKIYETQTGLYTTLHPVAGISLIVAYAQESLIPYYVLLTWSNLVSYKICWGGILNIRPRSFYTLPVW